MDPTRTAEALGTGNAQIVLGIALVAVCLALMWVTFMLVRSYEKRITMAEKSGERLSDNTSALRALTDVVKAALLVRAAP